jgi:hypothetical protein
VTGFALWTLDAPNPNPVADFSGDGAIRVSEATSLLGLGIHLTALATLGKASGNEAPSQTTDHLC